VTPAAGAEAPGAVAPPRSRIELWPLLVAIPLLLFSNGRWVIAAAAWLSPVFLLRFMRIHRRPWGVLGVAAALYGIDLIAWNGMIPGPGAMYFAVVAFIALSSFVPYLADRLLAPRIAGFASTLVFPCAWVTMEYLQALAGPYGTWGSAAYAMTDDLPLIQIVSVTGLWGVSFLVAWFAAVANWAWERGFVWREVRAGVLALTLVLAATHLLGGARVALAPAATRTIRVASFTQPPSGPYLGRLLQHAPGAGSLVQLRARLRAREDTLLALAGREAAAGARIVLWSECNLPVLKEDEAAVIADGSRLARETGIYLLMALAVFTPGQGYYENELVALDPAGNLSVRYHKARPAPGDAERGCDREIPLLETPFGRVAMAICFDMDFPQLIHRAGRERADLLIAPSSDWRAIDPLHTRMALMRGVENGCSVVRQTNAGLSAAADPQGRLLAYADYFGTRPDVMVAQVPVGGRRTLYAMTGDLFAYLCIATLAFLVRGHRSHAALESAEGAARIPVREPGAVS